MNQWQASMPTNIALIKYMGKKSGQKNVAENPSLSYTLNDLCSTVILTEVSDVIPESADARSAKADIRDPGQQKSICLDSGSRAGALGRNDNEVNLTTDEKLRFINHLEFLKNQFGVTKHYQISSENNFPLGCGLASSASSFAALTECALKAFGKDNLPASEKAQLSRHGSGSSCRSFFSPWGYWHGDTVEAIDLPYKNLIHHVVVVSKEKKLVSSSEAHQRVASSLLFADRPQRATKRLDLLLKAFAQQDWLRIKQLVWQEFWDMHALFETAEISFRYITENSYKVLLMLENFWHEHHDGPVITLDAGPNIHLLFRPDQQKMCNEIIHATQF